MRLEKHTFLITGGGSGLGAACVRQFVAAGATVVIADINQETGQQVATECGPATAFVSTNVTDEASVVNAIRTAKSTFGGLHGVVNCAGIGDAHRMLTKDGPHPLEKFSKIIQVNLIGTFNVVRLTAAAMAENEPQTTDGERGVIINTASVAAYDGQIGQAAYAASKGGIAALTLPLARDLARHGIRVVTIAPGIFDTPMFGLLPEAAADSLKQQIPFPARLGKPSEYAALAQHIVENTMLNGEVIRLDGAIRMAAR